MDQPLNVTAKLTPRLWSPQQSGELRLEVDVEDGFHIYRDSISVEINEPADFKVSKAQVHPTVEFFDKNTNQRREGVQSSAEIIVQIEAPQTLSEGLDKIRFSLNYQACADTFCLFPQNYRGEVPISSKIEQRDEQPAIIQTVPHHSRLQLMSHWPELSLGLLAVILFLGARSWKKASPGGRTWQLVVLILCFVTVVIIGITREGFRRETRSETLPEIHTYRPITTSNQAWRVFTPESFQLALKEKKPVLLDFWAEWCEACLLMEERTFSAPEIRNLLNEFILMRIDATESTPDIEKIKKEMNVQRLPTLIFFDHKGRKRNELLLQEFEDEKKFLRRLLRLKELSS